MELYNLKADINFKWLEIYFHDVEAVYRLNPLKHLSKLPNKFKIKPILNSKVHFSRKEGRVIHEFYEGSSDFKFLKRICVNTK